jgi:HrpA-like RNA helicase
MAFMERLRSMYANAASGKVGYDLSNPAEEDMQEKDKRPCPIAVPVGDLASIMEDHVLAVQKEQPWLVAPEARVPCLVDRVSGQNGLELPALTERQKEISHKLQKDLAWSLKNPSKQVQRIREQTHQLPAYQMRNEIVATVNANQVTLISASTGKSKYSGVCVFSKGCCY